MSMAMDAADEASPLESHLEPWVLLEKLGEGCAVPREEYSWCRFA